MDIEEKLARFSESVQKEAEMKKKSVVDEIQKKYDANVEEFEKKTKIKYEKLTEEAAFSEERRKQKAITDANSELKRKLIEKRTSYAKQIFDNIDGKLAAFFKSEKYKDLIIKEINSYKSMAVADIKVTMLERDKQFKDAIEKSTGATVSLVDDDFLGGVKIFLGNNRIADCTYKRKYENEKTSFNKIRIM